MEHRAIHEDDLRAKLPKIRDSRELDGILELHHADPGMTPAVRNMIEMRRAEIARRQK